MKTLILIGFFVSILCQPYAHAIIGGGPANESAYDAIGTLSELTSDETGCTATLIAEDWIVTAQHCRYGGSEEDPIKYEANQLKFRFGPDIASPSKVVKLKKWVDGPTIRFKNAQGVDEELELDIAFLQLAEPIRDVAISPIKISASGLENFQQRAYEIVGFGATDMDGMTGFGMRRKADMAVTSTSGNAFLNLFSTEGAFAEYLKQFFPGDEADVERHLGNAELIKDYTAHIWSTAGRDKGEYADSCYSDSGGPLLQKVDGGFRLVGVINSGFPGATYSCTPIGTIVTSFGPAVRKLMKANGILFEE